MVLDQNTKNGFSQCSRQNAIFNLHQQVCIRHFIPTNMILIIELRFYVSLCRVTVETFWLRLKCTVQQTIPNSFRRMTKSENPKLNIPVINKKHSNCIGLEHDLTFKITGSRILCPNPITTLCCQCCTNE